jgi:hypothetical protein
MSAGLGQEVTGEREEATGASEFEGDLALGKILLSGSRPLFIAMDGGG